MGTQVRTKLQLVAPITGILKPLAMGFAIVPKNGHAVAPVTGIVTEINAVTHRIILTTKAGVEVTVGLNQVCQQVNGQSCEVLVCVDNLVKAGQVLAAIDMVALQALDTPVEVQTTIMPAIKLKLLTTSHVVHVDTPVAELN